MVVTLGCETGDTFAAQRKSLCRFVVTMPKKLDPPEGHVKRPALFRGAPRATPQGGAQARSDATDTPETVH
jgi:hypothetical protein